jgi:DNA mismatch repair protein MutL
VAFLFLELPPDAVDVNVHPTNAEVRFRQPERVQNLVLNTVRKRLQGEDLTAPLRIRQAPAPAAEAPPPAQQTDLPFAAAPAASAAPPAPPPPPRPQPVRAAAAPVPASRHAAPAVPRPQAPLPRPAAPREPAAPQPVKAMQMHDLYLVVEVPEGVLVIDQHARHERVLFEQLKARLAEGQVEVQKLLIPEPVHFPPAQAALLLEQREALAALGLEVDDFGGGTVLLGGYPAVLGKRSPRDILRALVEYLSGKDRLPTREVLLNDLMALMACHAAVRAGDRLGQEEIQQLVAQRHLAQDAHHCPHGRPTSLLFTRNDLDRQYRRIS